MKYQMPFGIQGHHSNPHVLRNKSGASPDVPVVKAQHAPLWQHGFGSQAWNYTTCLSAAMLRQRFTYKKKKEED